MLRFERQYWEAGAIRVGGVDEAGRGPLAGPVVAAVVVLEPAFGLAEEYGLLDGLTDSKRLSPARRESFFELLQASPHVEIGIGRCGSTEIDELNILRATHAAMARAVADLSVLPDHLLVDGLPVKGLPCLSQAIVKGDGKSLSIAAASVVAKVVRDREMVALDSRHPQYGFARHKGYGSRAHMQALFEYGPCEAHRRTFAPVREASELQRRKIEQPPPR